jgi:large subunit ribosomal protein L10
MKRTDKEQLVSELSTKMRGASALYFTDFTGLNVKRMTELRRRLRRAGVEYVVIKNTLALRAVNESGLTTERLTGPTGVVLSKDGVAAAKVLAEFARENDQRPAVKGGLFEGQALDEAQVRKLATMASREQLLSQLAGTFQAPLSTFLGAMNALLSNFSGVLESLKAQKEGT